MAIVFTALGMAAGLTIGVLHALRRNGISRTVPGHINSLIVFAILGGAISVVAQIAVHLVIDHLSERRLTETVIRRLEKAVFLEPILQFEPAALEEMTVAISGNSSLQNSEIIARKTIPVALGLRQRYANPALLAAEETYLLDVWLTRAETLLWLSENDVDDCALFVSSDVAWPNALGRAFTAIYRRHLASLETAYVNGRTRPPQSGLDDQTYAAVLQAGIGLSKDQLEAIGLPEATDAQSLCTAGVRIATGLAYVPPELQMPFVRRVITRSLVGEEKNDAVE